MPVVFFFQGNTKPLIAASANGNINLVAVLLGRGAKVDIRGKVNIIMWKHSLSNHYLSLLFRMVAHPLFKRACAPTSMLHENWCFQELMSTRKMMYVMHG